MMMQMSNAIQDGGVAWHRPTFKIKLSHLLGTICRHLEQFGVIWSHLDICGPIGPIEPICTHLDPLGPIMTE